MQTIPMTAQEQAALRSLEDCLHDLLDATKQNSLLSHIEQRYTKEHLFSLLKGCKYQGHKISASWSKSALAEAYRAIRIIQRRHDLMAERDRLAQWLDAQGLSEQIGLEKLLHDAEEARLRIVIGPPDLE